MKLHKLLTSTSIPDREILDTLDNIEASLLEAHPIPKWQIHYYRERMEQKIAYYELWLDYFKSREETGEKE